jgi:methyl-accepting chemotaxis protein
VTEDIIGTLSASINQLGEETSRTLQEVQDIADQVRSACEFVGEQALRVDETAQQERAALEGMAAHLGQATYQLAQMAALSTSSSEAAELASAATDAALHAVDATVRGMEALRGTMAETEKRFKRLGERSQEISTVVNLIHAIAERTHVLSLNASMQASNAGEAGRSFVVVAEEVQRLSESARAATAQIAQLVQSIQVETGDTLLTMNRLIAEVVRQSEQARQAGAQMAQTRQTTAQLVSLVQQIAAFSQAQSTLAQELRLSVEQLDRGSVQTILAIEQQTESTATLVDYARRLSEAVGQFRLPPAQHP